MKWAIYGKEVRVLMGFTPNDKIIATFDTKEAAENYILSSRISSKHSDKAFHDHTLLRRCESACVRELPLSTFPPHNPAPYNNLAI